MYSIVFQPSFVRDLKKYKRSDGNLKRVHDILTMIRTGELLPSSVRDHQLQGTLRAYRELHVEADWLLVYQKDGKKLIITCLWLVSHKKLRERERSL